MNQARFGTVTQVFVSYAHLDTAIVQNIVGRLIARLQDQGIQFFFDRKDRPTEDVDGLPFGLSEHIATARGFVAFLSEHYLASKWCRAEFDAFARSQPLKERGAEAFGKDFSGGWVITVTIQSREGLDRASRRLIDELPAYTDAYLRGNHNVEPDLDATADAVAREIATCVRQQEEELPGVMASNPEELWSLFAASYPWLFDIPIADVISAYRPLPVVDASVTTRVEKYRSTEVVQLLTQIKKPWINVFSRSVGKGLLGLNYPLGDLVPVGRSGQPVQVLIAMFRDSAIGLPELQYSYYQCLFDGWQDWSVNTAAIGALAIAYDTIPTMLIENFHALLIEPLQSGSDLQELRWGCPS